MEDLSLILSSPSYHPHLPLHRLLPHPFPSLCSAFQINEVLEKCNKKERPCNSPFFTLDETFATRLLQE